MPWVLKGSCVHKQNADGKAGELVKCHETTEEAKRHMRALYANVHKGLGDEFAEFSMAIVKATNKDGEMKWRSVNSDIGEDYYGERMSVELFRDMIDRIENGNEVPLTFRGAICEEDWCGGMPYVSLSHYKSGKGMVNVPGTVQTVYLDGDKLKSTGTLYDNPLGRAVYKSLVKDLEQKSIEDKIRISIGFLDLEHSHGEKYTFVRKAVGEKCPLCSKGVGDKIYKKGVLVHLALTRIPANPRTDLEVEKSMTTKAEDLKSIVEDEEVIKNLELKSLADDALVMKNNDMDEDDSDAKDGKKKKKEGEDDHPMMKSTAEPETVAPVAPAVPEPVAPVVVERAEITPVAPAATAFDEALIQFKSKVGQLKASNVTGENALQELQASFDKLGEVVKAEFTPAPTPGEVNKETLESTLRSLLQEMLPQALSQAVAPMQAEISELRTLSTATKPQRKQEEAPTPRSLNLNLTQKAAVQQITQKTSSWSALANRSVGLPDNFVR